MYKLKNNSGASKRFRKCYNKIKYRHSFRNHILTKKSSKRKRKLRKICMVKVCNIKRIKSMLPV
ncbi:50S ribosomal protein L35 [Candidatus Portiera aleyrodidarum]|uniref:Large ribosomal subunit protein bL35 n=1 Tax=Candidatus Portiera aleyrodidarum MED (Bemisia tabaci) TaxID=1163752 RepID=A0AAU8S7I7_9GAMM|nr:50S ribosomal protein L35 [Candidatus Portiera aleyrodidarum]AFQ24154.1 LSU ribosomal protein L35P [Candidatus Portiera aleyrodidarum BT-B-HRs]AFS18916.1 50S ribosomal protein L35 [Candidatus Portiera aleyrodidarum BT-QVLC]AFT80555.1 LSU ribosomal protein L35p [Candidatus Portiera aleyrodidarum BT-QVLC]AFT80834.1 LSU ribosomal protein L35p [Candidatus Portiera aleyrodidarum BT-B-HRs]AJF24130.1 50S ribosomal protein L35 [Candidatus Portiera aleyrodidarum MED (Bemisia tabaci)]